MLSTCSSSIALRCSFRQPRFIKQPRLSHIASSRTVRTNTKYTRILNCSSRSRRTFPSSFRRITTISRGDTVRHLSTSLPEDFQITGVPDDVAQMIHKHASRPQTGASLQTLMKTGRGELLPKTYKDYEHDPQSENCKLATNKILMQVAGFLRHELPIRLSHRILDLDRVPLMKEMSSVKQVRDLYVTSFLELLSVKKRIESVQQEQAFAEILDSVYERHASVLVQMARGAFELRAAIKKGNLPTTTIKQSMVQFDSMEDMHAILDRFYVSRIG